jgi:hypothetical protein
LHGQLPGEPANGLKAAIGGTRTDQMRVQAGHVGNGGQ